MGSLLSIGKTLTDVSENTTEPGGSRRGIRDTQIPNKNTAGILLFNINNKCQQSSAASSV